MNSISMYTDGASRGNPGPGGYGILLIWGDYRREFSQGYRLTTNNRMELMAVIKGLEAIRKNTLPVVVYSDSKYVVDAVEKGWLNKWIRTHFKGGKKNSDLWIRYYELSRQFNIRFVWVKGHASNPYNNRCDELATAAADDRTMHLVDTGYRPE